MFATDPADPPSALPRGTRLGEFELRRVLGAGGFGIVYLAFDHALEREVAIKEYMPVSLAGRTAAFHVSLLSQSNAENFALGLRSFVNEARLLARFDHPSLVKVHRYWEDNHTAYMAMPFYAGHSLQAVRRQLPEHPSEAWVRAILDPLLGAVERLHLEGVYHRDIAPDNVILRPDGRPVLLDFGAARRVLADRSVALTAILKPAYAPIEQYGETGAVKQGPWTDLYALGATMHHLLLGQAPTPSTSRAVVDEMLPIASRALPGCSTAFLECIDWMLKPRPAERPQSVAALRQALAACLPAMPGGNVAGGAYSAADWLPTMALAPAAARPSVRSVPSVPSLPSVPSAASLSSAASAPAHAALQRVSTPIDNDATVRVPHQFGTGMPMAGLPPTGLPTHLPAPPPTSTGPAAPHSDQRVRANAAVPPLHTEPTLSPTATVHPAGALPSWAPQRTDPTLIDDDGAPMPPLTDTGSFERVENAGAATGSTARPTPSTAAHPQPGHTSRAAPRLALGLAGGAVAAGIALWLAWPQAGPRPPGADAGSAATSTASQPAAATSAGSSTATAVTAVTATAAQSAGNPAVLTAATPPTAPPAPDGRAAAAPSGAPAAAAAVAQTAVPAIAQAVPAKAQAPAPTATPAKGAVAARTAAAVAAAAAASAAAAAQAALAAPPPSADTSRAGLATSITRLPTADPSPGAHAPNTPPAAPATGLSPIPGPSANPPPSPSPIPTPIPTPAAASPQRATPAAPAANPAATAVTVPTAGATIRPATATKTPERDNEPVLMQARALSPSERCEGRVLVALWACVERQCKSDASLRDHPECQKLRREP